MVLIVTSIGVKQGRPPWKHSIIETKKKNISTALLQAKKHTGRRKLKREKIYYYPSGQLKTFK